MKGMGSNQKTIMESLVSGSPVKDPEKLLQVCRSCDVMRHVVGAKKT